MISRHAFFPYANMLKQAHAFLMVLCLAGAFAQTPGDAPLTIACSYYGETLSAPIASYRSSDDAQHVISEIVAIVGLKPNFEVRAADIPNAAAVIYRNKRLVLYNPGFTERLNRKAKSNWASVSILAHEIGHHLNGHTLLESGSRPDIELEADEFSGFVLRKMGATLQDAQLAMSIAASVKASHTHPGKASRLAAIAQGWTTADEQIAGKASVPKTNKQIEKPVVPRQPEKESNEVLAEKYIAYDVHFTADPAARYFVTVRDHLVKVEGGSLYVVATFAKSNRNRYAAMFYDKHYNYLYVTTAGSIVNGAGKKVGTIKKHA
jgi:hypothetical protein